MRWAHCTTGNRNVIARGLPPGKNKLRLAIYLTGLSTEGDYGHDTLQEVANTLAAALRERPLPWTEPQDTRGREFNEALMPAYAYRKLAQLVRYEEVRVSLDGDEHYRGAMSLLRATDETNQLFTIQGVPKSFVYDRTGKLVAQAINMRTQQQFLSMLSKAGLE